MLSTELQAKLQRMRELPIIGNAFSDRELLLLTGEIACCTVFTPCERVEAIHKLEDTVGMPHSTGTDREICDAYMDEMRECGLLPNRTGIPPSRESFEGVKINREDD